MDGWKEREKDGRDFIEFNVPSKPQICLQNSMSDDKIRNTYE